MQADDGDCGQRLSGRRDRRSAHPAFGQGARHHAKLEGDDPSAQCHRAGHRANEDGSSQGRNPLKGALSDALHAVMCGAGHNLRLILAKVRLLAVRCGLILPVLLATFFPSIARTQLAHA